MFIFFLECYSFLTEEDFLTGDEESFLLRSSVRQWILRLADDVFPKAGMEDLKFS